MNIAILIPALYGGGAERVAQRIGNYYVERGCIVYYFLADINIKQDYVVKGEIIRTSIKSYMDESLNDMQKLLRLFCSTLEMRKLKRKYKIDVAISFMEEFNYLNVLSKGREKVITRVCTILSQREDYKGFLYKNSVVRFFYSNTDKVIVTSKYAIRDMLLNYRVPAKKLFMIPNFVDTLDLNKDEVLSNMNTKIIICVGRLEPIKQQDRIIRAFSYVCEIEPDAKLIILGKGIQLQYLKSLCKRIKIEKNVSFEGFTDNIQYYMEKARAFVIASKVEGFPNSMIEAMNYGVPVITTDTPGACGEIVGKPQNISDIDDIVYCKYGILTPCMPNVKPNVNSSLAEQEIILGKAMLKVLKEDDVYETYRKQSFIRAEIFNINRVIRYWDKVINY